MHLGIDLKHEGFAGTLVSRDFIELGQVAEQRGFESVWTNEDVGYDSLALLTAVGQHTRTVRLGTAIVNVYSRTAMQLAMGAATLDELSSGRLILGLSVGHHPWNDLGHGVPLTSPLSRLREYVAFLREALSGRPFRHDGEVFTGVDTQLHVAPVRSSIPIHVAGERPRIIALAGGVADGLMINVVSADYISEFAAPHLRESATAAGRDPERLELTALVTCCVTDDASQALAQARGMLVHRLRHSLKMLDTQPKHRHAEIRRLHGLMQAGRRAEAAATADEELARSIVCAGTGRDVRDGIGRYRDAGCTRVIVVAYPRDRASVMRVMDAVSPLLNPPGG